MCRNIKTLFNFEPPATELEIRDASLQFVRKLSGFNVPSKQNEAAFERAVEEVAASARTLIQSLVTSAEPGFSSATVFSSCSSASQAAPAFVITFSRASDGATFVVEAASFLVLPVTTR